MDILIICQAGEEVGLGHLSRSLSLADALRERGAMPRLAVWGAPLPGGGTRAGLEDYEHLFLEEGREGAEALREELRGRRPDAAVMDLSPEHLPGGLSDLLGWMRDRNISLVGVDGPLAMAHEGLLDLLFIPSFLFEERHSLPDDLPKRWGWECIMTGRALEPRPWEEGSRVLVLTGGSDATGLGRSLPARLDRRLPEGAELHWVRGPWAPQPRWPEEPRLDYEIHQAPSRLDELMREANYALTVYGVSFFELLSYGVPTVVFSPYGGRDDRHLEEVDAEGAALTAASPAGAVERLAELMGSPSEAKALSRRGRELRSRDGAQELAKEILNLRGE